MIPAWLYFAAYGTVILAFAANMAATAVLRRLRGRREGRAWAGDPASRARQAEARAAEVALLNTLYALDSAEETS